MSKPIGTDEMLDRIEQLAAINEELEAKLAKAVEALQYMVNHAGQLERNEGIYWEATEIARTTLAELKGQAEYPTITTYPYFTYAKDGE